MLRILLSTFKRRLRWPKKNQSARVFDEAAASSLTLAPAGDAAATAATVARGAWGGGLGALLTVALAPLAVASCLVCYVKDVEAAAAAEMEDFMVGERMHFAIYL